MRQQGTTAVRRSQFQFRLWHMLLLVTIVAAVGGMDRLLVERERLSREEARQAHRRTQRQIAEQDALLLVALNSMDARSVSRYLRAGASPGLDHLLIPIRNGDSASLKLLTEAGAEVNPVDYRSHPLVAVLVSDAAEPVKLEMLHVLLNRGADPEAAIDLAAYSQNHEFIEALCDAGASFGIREMVIAGYVEQVKRDLDPAALNTPVRPFWGTRSLLGIALRSGHGELSHWLLDQGASLDMREVHQMTAMHCAAVGNCEAVISRLHRQGLHADIGDVTGETPLEYCISSATPDTVRALIQAGADVNRTGNVLKKTVLHSTIERLTARPDPFSMRPRLPAHLTVEKACLEIVELLLAAGANPDQADRNGLTARELARECSSPQIRELLR